MKGRLLDAIPLNSLTGVGAAQSSKLAKIGLHTVQDLLLHLPLRYEDRTQLYKIGDLLPAIYATVEGEVLNCNITFGGRRMMTCQISDGTGILTMRFFNFSAAMKNSLATGRRVLAYGEAKRGKYGAEMIHPEYRVQGDLSTPEMQETLLRHYRAAAARAGAGHDEPARGAANPASTAANAAAQRFRKRQTPRTTASYP